MAGLVDCLTHAKARSLGPVRRHRRSGTSRRPSARARIPCSDPPIGCTAVHAKVHDTPGCAPTYDVVALGNLCVDAFVEVDVLPPRDAQHRKRLLKELSQQPPAPTSWEKEGLIGIENLAQATSVQGQVTGTPLDETLVCYVIVDPNSKHTFCSSYDYGPWPLLAGITSFPAESLQMLATTRAVYTNGYIFDELPTDIITNAVQYSTQAGAAAFFDPGPRCATMTDSADPERRKALDRMLDLCQVILMTEDEAEIVTGTRDPVRAANWVLQRPSAKTQWVVLKMGAEGAVIVQRGSPLATYKAPALKVDVVDTVGCGDSFAAAVVLGYTRGVDAATTLALANAVGAATASSRGAGRNVATASKVQRLLQQNGGVANVPEALRILEVSLQQKQHRLMTPAGRLV